VTVTVTHICIHVLCAIGCVHVCAHMHMQSPLVYSLLLYYGCTEEVETVANAHGVETRKLQNTYYDCQRACSSLESMLQHVIFDVPAWNRLLYTS
jgi:hypothetical protein